uniref:Calmodulin n=1 Tax=Ditylum brightwellii TaxID=49249 RepID=A0A7S4V4H4_9STRA
MPLISLFFLRQHCSLTPYVQCENIMLSSWDESKAQVKLIDFGGSMPVDKQGNGTEDEASKELGFMLTVPYSSPERLNDAKGAPSLASDMFAVGVIVYILLTGTHPFNPEGTLTEAEMENLIKSLTPNATGEKLLNDTVFSDDRVSDLSDSCICMMKQLFHPDPKKRMTADEFRRHPWVQGLEASWKVIEGSDIKARQFWQKRFRDAILKKYGNSIEASDGSLSDTNLKSIFQTMDIDGNGSLDGFELRTLLRHLGVSENDVSLMVASIDTDKSGDVDFTEFKSILRSRFEDGQGVPIIRTKRQFQTALLNKFARREGGCDNGTDKISLLMEKQCLRRIFNYIDLDSSGTLEYKEFETFLIQMGFPLEDATKVLETNGMGHDSEINWDRFCDMMADIFDANAKEKAEEKQVIHKILKRLKLRKQ